MRVFMVSFFGQQAELLHCDFLYCFSSVFSGKDPNDYVFLCSYAWVTCEVFYALIELRFKILEEKH